MIEIVIFLSVFVLAGLVGRVVYRFIENGWEEWSDKERYGVLIGVAPFLATYFMFKNLERIFKDLLFGKK